MGPSSSTDTSYRTVLKTRRNVVMLVCLLGLVTRSLVASTYTVLAYVSDSSSQHHQINEIIIDAATKEPDTDTVSELEYLRFDPGLRNLNKISSRYRRPKSNRNFNCRNYQESSLEPIAAATKEPDTETIALPSPSVPQSRFVEVVELPELVEPPSAKMSRLAKVEQDLEQVSKVKEQSSRSSV
jgi:hypothetical protein